MNKPKIEIVIPEGACGCSYSEWINNLWDLLNKYKDKVEIETLTSDTDRAKKLGIGNRGVVVNEVEVPVFLLKEKLNELLS